MVSLHLQLDQLYSEGVEGEKKKSNNWIWNERYNASKIGNDWLMYTWHTCGSPQRKKNEASAIRTGIRWLRTLGYPSRMPVITVSRSTIYCASTRGEERKADHTLTALPIEMYHHHTQKYHCGFFYRWLVGWLVGDVCTTTLRQRRHTRTQIVWWLVDGNAN